MTQTFLSIVERARTHMDADALPPPQECVAAARAHYEACRLIIRKRHEAGESGADILRALSDLADEVLRGVFAMAMCVHGRTRGRRPRVALCALGGYGRRELCPYSDVDLCLVYEGRLNRRIRALNDFLVPIVWDIGFRSGYGMRSVKESIQLAKDDTPTFISLCESRLLDGNPVTFARLQLNLADLRTPKRIQPIVQEKAQQRYASLSDAYRNLFAPEPNIKENAGCLRDYHTAIWICSLEYGTSSLDEIASQGLITGDEQLEIAEALDFIWRIRNEMHFTNGRADDVLTFERQRRVAEALGYGGDVGGFMQDFYAAARMVRRFLRIVARSRSQSLPERVSKPGDGPPADIRIENGFLYAAAADADWFAHNPIRLVEVFWRCARHQVRLSRQTELRVKKNLSLVNDALRSNGLARRFFVAICNRPLQAGLALREAARSGFLGRYIPEFDAVQGILRYEDFHSYPTDEHTLRAIEALALLPQTDTAVGRCLQEAIENLADPYILVMALLFHDLGKVEGDVHVEASVRLTHQICRRMGMPPEDEERIAFLVHHHILMTTISQYRDIDDEDIVREFAVTMQNEQRLRALFLISYADLSAVGPGVWNDWKGALLMQLYLRTVKLLLGRAETEGDQFWLSAKAAAVRSAAPVALQPQVENHLRGLGQRYFIAFLPEQIVQHLEAVARVPSERLVLIETADEVTGTTDLVICTYDRPGLFAIIAGSLSSQLIDVNNAAAFTTPSGIVVDSFKVTDARRGGSLTRAQVERVEMVLRDVLLDNGQIAEHVEKARRKLFALLQPKVPIPTRIKFDNWSSRSHTVVDIETGDRTGLLYDITQALSDCGLNIASSRIVTDARRIRDSFYLTKDGRKITTEAEQAEIEAALQRAIHPHLAATV